ncbi:MAG: TrmH family RNA methyltransferase [Saprospiraceae bacterium]
MNKQLDFQEIRTNAAERIENIQHNRMNIALLCDRMTDAKNVGAMFRIADAARLEKIYFFQSTVDFTHKKLTKVARSTNKYVDFEKINDFKKIQEIVKEYEVIALDKTSESINYTDLQLKSNKKILLIIGAERFGVSPELLNIASTTIHLPMLGVNTSMNVSVATGIAVYYLCSFSSLYGQKTT